MGYRNIGFAPMAKPKENDKPELPEGALVLGQVPLSMEENLNTAEVLIKVAGSVRDNCAKVGLPADLADGAAVFVAQVCADMKLRVVSQAEYETLVRVFRGFEVAVNRLAVLRNNQN